MAYKTGFYKGRLGIGLTDTMGMGDGNPRYPLDINGDIRITGSIVNEVGKSILGGGSSGATMAVRKQTISAEPTWTDDVISVEDMGLNDLLVTGDLQLNGQLLTDGNVGIGTTSPQGQLSLYQSGDNGGELWFGNSDINGSTSKNYGKISFNTYLGGGVPYRHIGHIRCIPYGSNYGGDIIFHTNNDIYGGGDRMVIRGNGNVGIGTTSPGYPLVVQKNGSAGRIATFICDTAGNSGIAISPKGGSDADGYIEINGSNSSAHGKHVFIGCTRNGSDTYNSNIVFKTRHNEASYHYHTAAERMRIQYNGNVGIGTTSPFGKLDIKHSNWTQTPTASTMCDMLNLMVSSPSTTGEGNMRTLLCFADGYRNNSATKDTYRVRMRMSGAGWDMIWKASGTNSTITETIGTNTTDNNFIFARDHTAFLNKNVGIGTTSPDAKLEVNGDLNIEATNDNWNTSVGKGLYLRFYGGTVNKGYIQSIDRSNSDENFPLLFYASTYTFNSTSGQVAIDSDGNVGIGMTDPASPLEIKCTAGGTTHETQWTGAKGLRLTRHDGYAWEIVNGHHNDLLFRNLAANGTVYRDNVLMLDDNGNVGIGTNSPDTKLHVNGGKLLITETYNGYQGGKILGGVSDNAHAIHFRVGEDGATDVLDFHEYGKIRFYTNGLLAAQTEKMCILSNGNVGIGTDNPRSRLDVIHTTTDIVGDYQDTDAVLNIYGGEDKRCINIVTGNHAGSSTHHRYPAMVFHPTRDNNIQHQPGGSIEFTDRPGSGTYSEQVRQTDIFIRTSARHSYNRILRDVCTISADGYVRGINAFQNDSDDRIKHNEKNINEGLNVINKLQAKEYFKTSTLFDENGNIYDSNHNFDLNNEGLPIDASGEVLIDVNKEIGFIAQEVFEIDELKHAVQEGDLVPDASGNMYKTKFGLCYEEIFVMNVVATQELDKKVTAIEDNNQLQINNTENIIGNIPFVNGYTIVNNKKLYNNNISDKLYFNPETGKLKCPNIESTYYGDGSNLQGIATESQINDLIEENKKLKQDNENNKELINFWTQQAMNLNNKLTTMENELKIIKENLGL